MSATLSVIIPCYNEEKTLQLCVSRVLEVADNDLDLDIVIVDDKSEDNSVEVAEKLVIEHSNIRLYKHKINQGKGAALRTGIDNARGDYVAIQDADLEYDPGDLKKLLEPIVSGKADVVFGSRFLSAGAHRVFHFWHYVGNKFLTLLSNMLTDLNLTDMETCYKVFRREIIQRVQIEENRFGFEPEVVAKVAHQRLRIYEMGISYAGRSYAEGKKIGVRDGFRALYCILRYNAHKVSVVLQFLIFTIIGTAVGLLHFLLFLIFYYSGITFEFALLLPHVIVSIFNYFLCTTLLFRSQVRWNRATEIILYAVVVMVTGLIGLMVVKYFFGIGVRPLFAGLPAVPIVFAGYFLAMRYVIFPESKTGKWRG